MTSRTSLVAIACVIAGCSSPPTPAPHAAAPPPAVASAQAEPPAPPPAAPARDYPPTRRDDVVERIHGTEVHDPYRWLEDPSRPEVAEWMKAQDRYARDHLARLLDRDALAARFAEVFYFDDLDPPRHRGGRYFFSRKHKDKEKAIVHWQHVFDDFVAAARWLETSGWTSRDHLAISGGSNGGLLMGTAITQAPELFKAVVCEVPLLDMVRYHRFGSGTTWVPEYGSAEDAAQFQALYAYSPYHHVTQGTAYPAVLMSSADHDDRVDPLHARKFTALLQWAAGGDAPV